MVPGEEETVINIVTEVFNEFVAPQYSDEGITEFYKYANAINLAERSKENHFTVIAELNNMPVAIIEIRNNDHVALFFNKAKSQKKGIGKELLKYAVGVCLKNNPTIQKITVNSSPNATKAYEKMGFTAVGEEQCINGIKFVPMSLDLCSYTSWLIHMPNIKMEEIKTMEFSINPISHDDREAIMDIFNYYVENSFAAYPEHKLPYQAFDMLLQISNGYPTGVIRDSNSRVLGFGMLRTHNPMPAFSQTAEVTYFILPDHTGKGLGKALLDYLEKGAIEKGITNILTNISSLNPGSIKFHQKNGFEECGRFRKVGKKNGQEFDTVWMQKML
jgi:phosphinothricin acetyltransferase